MKKTLLIMIASTWITLSFTQNIDTITDSEIIETVIVADSLQQTVSDSTVVKYNSEGQLEYDTSLAVEDSLWQYRLGLKTDLDDLAKNDEITIPLDYFYRNNFSFITSVEPKIELTINSFSLIDTTVSNSSLLTSYLPFYRANNGNMINLDNDNYELEVPLSIIYLGLGENEFTNTYFSLQKGRLYDIDNLNMEFILYGQQNNGYNVSEKSTNLNFHLFYTPQAVQFHYYTTLLSQELSVTNKTPYYDLFGQGIDLEKSITHAFLIKSKFIEFGYKLNTNEYDAVPEDFDVNYNQLLIGSKYQVDQHRIAIYYEKFFNDFNYHNLRWDHCAKQFGFEFTNNGIIRSNDNHLIDSQLAYTRFPLWAGISYFDYEQGLTQRDILANIGFKSNQLNITYATGSREIDDNENMVQKIGLKSKLSIDNFDLILNGNMELNEFDPPIYPELLLKSDFELIWNLGYNNAIKTGVHYTLIPETITEQTFDLLDLYLKIRVSNYFEIYGTMHNVLNQKPAYIALPIYSGQQISYGIKWIFIN